jgi:MFS family permease
MSELLVPGTVHQVDVSNHVQGLRRSSKHQDIILLPQPSNHPDDPLNWGKWRKYASVLGYNIYTFGVVLMVSCYTPANLQIQEKTGIPVADINTGVGIYFLFIGYSNLIWQSVAINYGRRPVLLASFLLVIVQALWQAWCKTTTQWYINRVLMGISAGPVETLIELVVADLHFSHERGFFLSIYVCLLFSGPFLGCIPAGFIADRFGWQWIEYIVSIIGAGLFIWLFFTFEETAFYRPDVVAAESIDEIAKVAKDTEANVGSTDTMDKVDHSAVAVTGTAGSSDRTSDIVGEPKPYWKRLGVTSGYDSRRNSSVWKNCYLSITLLRFPAIIYSGLLVALSLSWFNVVNGTLPTILGGAPYNFSANIVGIFYVAAVIGVVFGSYFSGQLSDIVAVYMARRNNGVFEPEHRLWVFLIALILHPAGCLLFGVGAAHNVHWVGLAFGLGLFCATLPMGSSVAYNYIIDSYKEVAGEGLVSVILVRNTIGKSQSTLNSLANYFRLCLCLCRASYDQQFGFAGCFYPFDILGSLDLVPDFYHDPLRKEVPQDDCQGVLAVSPRAGSTSSLDSISLSMSLLYL